MSPVTRLQLPDAGAPREESAAVAIPEEEALSLRRVLSVLRRRAAIIAGLALLVTSLAALFVNQLTPRYRTQVELVVESSRQNVADLKAVVQNISPDFYTNETEAAIIGSRELARKAVERLNLISNPLFNPDLRPPRTGLVDSLMVPAKSFIEHVIVKPLKGLLFSDDGEIDLDEKLQDTSLSAEERRELMLERITSAYLAGLEVVPQDRSRVITVRYVSTDPQMAALGANTTAEVYILDQLTTKGQATSRASQWLNERVNEMRRRVIESEKRLEEFRRTAGIVEVGGATLYQQQLVGLNEELVQARTQRAEAEARYEQVQGMIEANQDTDTVASVLDSRLIQSLREQEAGLSSKMAELSQQFRPNHPTMKRAKTELAGLQTKIASEVKKIVINLGNELKIARVREANLQREVTRLQELLDQQNDAEVTLRALDSEVRANKQLYETLLARFKETNVQRDDLLQQADARIISRATVPAGPFYPRKKLMIVGAFLLSLLVGVAISLIAEFLDSGFRSLNQVEAFTGLPTIGLIPGLEDLDEHGKRPHEIAVERPNSSYGEAIRTLRTALLLSRVDHPPRSIIITSSVPGEGKTTTALSLACTAARSAQKAIVIDCDLRHSSLHTNLRHPNQVGLGDYLVGLATLEDVVEIDPRSGVHFITGGSRAPNPTDLLGSPEMRKLIAQLTKLYDLVVLDTPPLLAVSDALVLVRHVDKALFLVRWEKTRRETAMAGLKMIIEAGGDLAGIMLTLVNMRKHAQYDYADSGYYYYGSYKNYYTE